MMQAVERRTLLLMQWRLCWLDAPSLPPVMAELLVLATLLRA